MFCHFCGKEVEDSSIFCTNCGKRLADDADSAVEAAKETVEKAVEAVNETADNAAEAVKEITEENVETAAEAAKDAAETAAEVVNDTAQEVTEGVESAVETAAESSEGAVEAAAENAAETVKETAESAAEPTELVLKAPEEIPIGADGAENTAVGSVLSKKKIAVIAAAVAVFVVLVVLIACLGSAAGSSKIGTRIKGDHYMTTIDDETIVFYNGKKLSGAELPFHALIGVTSADGAAAVAYGDMIAYGDTGLFYLSDEKITEITDETCYQFELSLDGSTVAYSYGNDIYLFADGKSKKAASGKEVISDFVISPNGDTVVYVETDGSGRYSTYAVKGGKVIDLDARIYPLSVSNGGSVIYGMDKNSKLCYIKNLKADSSESVGAFNGMGYCFTNADNKQIVYDSGNGTYYFDTSLDEPIKIAGNGVIPIYPSGGVELIDDFKSFVAFSNGRIYEYTRKGKDYDSEKLAAVRELTELTVKLSSDGKTLLYLNSDGELCRVDVSKPDDKKVLAEDVVGFFADDSLKHIYFGNQDEDVRYYDGKSKNGKKIFSEESTAVGGGITPNGVLVFADEDGDLYYSDRGGDKKKAGIDDVTYIFDTRGAVYVDADGDKYVSMDGKKFTKS